MTTNKVKIEEPIYSENIRLDIFKCGFEIAIFDHFDHFLEAYNLKDMDPIDPGHADGFMGGTWHDGWMLVGINVKCSGIPTCAHEATHAVNLIFQKIGQKIDLLNDEIQAYLIGFLTDEFYKVLTKGKKELRLLKKQNKKN